MVIIIAAQLIARKTETKSQSAISNCKKCVGATRLKLTHVYLRVSTHRKIGSRGLFAKILKYSGRGVAGTNGTQCQCRQSQTMEAGASTVQFCPDLQNLHASR